MDDYWNHVVGLLANESYEDMVAEFPRQLEKLRAEARAEALLEAADRAVLFYDETDGMTNLTHDQYGKALRAAIIADEPNGECPHCDGAGYTSEHSPGPQDHDEEGNCLGFCPVQVQCEHCEGTGFADEPK